MKNKLFIEDVLFLKAAKNEEGDLIVFNERDKKRLGEGNLLI
jgi:hypothetical protein